MSNDKDTIKREVLDNTKKFTKDTTTVNSRVCKLLREGLFSSPLNSAELISLINDEVGKRVKITELVSALKPLLKKGIIKSTMIGNNKVWFPGWLNKAEVKESLKKGAKDKSDYFELLKIHPEIRNVSERLFHEEHYSQAIEDAFKKMILMVKERTGRQKENGKELDGKDLMMKVFNKDRPLLKLNKLKIQSDFDEQEGFRFIFAGAVEGIRNPKAHEIVDQKDPIRTLWYISLASLLATRIDEATK